MSKSKKTTGLRGVLRRFVFGAGDNLGGGVIGAMSAASGLKCAKIANCFR
jgi:hypothetical protein